jgi:NAD(P)-dependent dehydrogenase (short-subunit alcohol dehydrogenase family)
MTGRVEGKIVLITGAARGQGRDQAVTLAEQGADIVALDLCADIDSVPYPLATREELDETAKLVADRGRRVVVVETDIRDRGFSALGAELPIAAWTDTVDVNLVGMINTVHAALPHLSAGASIIATGSLVGLRPRRAYDEAGPGSAGYKYAKRALAHYVHELATVLAPERIRVNAVHPTNVDTPMLQNDSIYRQFRRDLENPTRADAEPVFGVLHPMPVPFVDAADITHAVLYLASDESRYVTGMQLRVDAGGYLTVQEFHA